MKHEIYLKPCPPELLQKAEQERFVLISKHYYNRDVRIIYQGEKESLLYTFIYTYSGDTEGEETILPDYIIVADMEEKKWDTCSVEEEKWGKKTLGTANPGNIRDTAFLWLRKNRAHSRSQRFHKALTSARPPAPHNRSRG